MIYYPLSGIPGWWNFNASTAVQLLRFDSHYSISLDGNHRVCIAKFLGIEEIECKVGQFEKDIVLEKIFREFQIRGYSVKAGSRDLIDEGHSLETLDPRNDDWLIETPINANFVHKKAHLKNREEIFRYFDNILKEEKRIHNSFLYKTGAKLTKRIY